MTPTVEPASGYHVEYIGASAVSARFAGVYDFDGVMYGEAVLRGTARVGRFSGALELAGVGGQSERWSDLSLGNLIVEARILTGDRRNHALGLRGSIALEPSYDAPYYWVTEPAASVPNWALDFCWDVGGAGWAVQTRTGFKTDGAAGLFGNSLLDMVDVGLGGVWVRPIAGPIAFVGEGEAQLSRVPLQFRALVRVEPIQRFTVDLGVAVAPVDLINDPTIQAVASVRKSW